MNYLNSLDYTVIVSYLLILLSFGFFLQRKASSSLEDYLVGGRSLPWWTLGVSGMASWIDITGTMLIVSLLFIVGPRALFIEFRGGAQLPLMFFLLWTGKYHRRSQSLTAAEWMIFRFGDNWQGRAAQLLQVIATIVGTIGMLAYLIKGVGMFFAMFMPFTPFTCSVILMVVSTVYTMVSGFYGVVLTDVFQAAIIVVAVIIVTFMASGYVESVEQVQLIANEVTGTNNWTKAYPDWHENMPGGYEAYRHLLLFTFFCLLKTGFGGLGSGNDPKFFAAKSDRECGLIAFVWTWCVSLRWPLMISFAILGLFLAQQMFPDQSVIQEASELVKEYCPGQTAASWDTTISLIVNNPDSFNTDFIEKLKDLLGDDDWVPKLQLVGFNGHISHELILPAVLLHTIMPGLRGLFLVALIAASMSSFDTSAHRAVSLFVRDVYQKHLRPKAPTKELVLVSWISVALLVIICFAFSYSLDSINHIYSWITMGLAGGLSVPIVLRLYWWRFNGGGFAIGTAAGIIAAVLQRALIPNMNEVLQFCYIVAIGFVCTVIGTYMTKPTEKEVLRNFYRHTKPFGLWKPMLNEMHEDEIKLIRKEHKYDILSLPFAFMWQVSLFMLPMTLIIQSYNAFLVALIPFSIGLCGLYFLWYKNLPEHKYENRIEDISSG